MKIYIAGSFSARDRLRPIRDELWKLGHEVVSTWLDETAIPEGMDLETFRRQLAIKDVSELKQSDLVIQDTIDLTTTGGSDVEFGLALAQLKARFVVGPPKSVFHRLADQTFSNWGDCLSFLKSNHPGKPHATGV